MHFFQADAFEGRAQGSINVAIMTDEGITRLRGRVDILKGDVLVMMGQIIQKYQRGYVDTVRRNLDAACRNYAMVQSPGVPQESVKDVRMTERERDQEDSHDDDRDSVKRHRSH
jgi:hypothetical protein